MSGVSMKPEESDPSDSTVRLSPLHLAEMLRTAGALPCGSVEAVEVRRHVRTSISNLFFLTVAYSSDASPLPNRLLVKWPLEAEETAECEFYQNLAPALPSPPIVRSVAVAAQAEATPWLILEDLSDTHSNPSWPLPVSPQNGQRAVAALAQIHARWWEAPSLGASVGEPHTAESLTSMVRGIGDRLPAFFDEVGELMPSGTRHALESVFSSSLSPWLRLLDRRALTIAHGDAYTWNFLFPKCGDTAAYLIDWQTWHVDVGARDLAFMIALHWYPEYRREVEKPLLQYYHRSLTERGVVSYSFDDLWLDYRRCAIRNLTFPIIFWSRGFAPEAWWHRLECAMAAYEDLGCAEIL